MTINKNQWSLTVSVLRHTALYGVLLHARGGTLDPGWRSNPAVAACGGSKEAAARLAAQDSPGLADARQLAFRELVETPPGLWEPYAAAGDWRRALDAWHQTALDSRERYEKESQLHWDAMREEATAVLPPGAPPLRMFERPSLIDPADARMARDMLGASYRAGLAAGGGGDPDNWRAWLRPRIASWPAASQKFLAGEIDQLVDQLDQPIPAYWRSGKSA